MQTFDTKDEGKDYVLVFSQVHLDFRIPEFESICSLFNINFDTKSLTAQNHVVVMRFDDDNCVNRILSRSVLLRSAIELIASGTNYEELCQNLENESAYLKIFNSPEQSFAIRLHSIGRKRDHNYVVGIINKIGSVLPLDDAPVDLAEPVNVFFVIEENVEESNQWCLKRVFFGKLVGYGQGKLKSIYNLSDRIYIGNTTMDPELSFIQANLVKANFGTLTLDPFCGTGGLLLAAAHFGSYVFGTEINYQIARACGKSSRVGVKYLDSRESIYANFVQYGLQCRLMSILIADASWHELWHCLHHGLFDSIVADPPYGVREKGSKVGSKQRKPHWTLPGSKHVNHYPEKAKYAMSSVFLDLLDLAAITLVVGGRLSFWFPVFDQVYSEDVLPRHDSFKMVANCKQPLSGKYSRRLLVYEKVRLINSGEKAYFKNDCYKELTFREKIFVNAQ
uniref:tRNA (guanine(10)-N(2))-methyltransferase TRMT11 n=1 Tax=Syphacia muris TaxID=451379 RepID=A0A0N5AIV3_9BILA